METEKYGQVHTLEVTLECISEEAATEVMRRCDLVPEERLGPHNRARREGRNIVLTYINKMWPFDVADMAGELELARDEQAARVIACL